MKTSHYLFLDKIDALSLFCFHAINPAATLKTKQELIRNENYDADFKALRTMTLVVKILLNYRSDEVRMISQLLCKRFIEDIYPTEETEISFSDLKFLIPIILKYRNLTKLSEVRKLEIPSDLINSTRQKLVSLKVIPSLQTRLFT